MGKISRRHKRFVEMYFKLNMNATRAYMAIYSTKNFNSAASSASALLKTPKVEAYIQERLVDIQLGADQILSRLSEQGLGLDDRYVTSEGIDVDKLISDGKGHMVKSISITPGKFGDARKVEVYDAQAALIALGRHHKLFTDVSEQAVAVRVDGIQALLDTVYGAPDKDADDQSG